MQSTPRNVQGDLLKTHLSSQALFCLLPDFRKKSKPFTVVRKALHCLRIPSTLSGLTCSLLPHSLCSPHRPPCAYSTCQISSSPGTFKHTGPAMPMTGSLSYFRPSSNVTSEAALYLALAPAFTGPRVVWFISSRLLTSTCMYHVYLPACSLSTLPIRKKTQEGKDLNCPFTTSSPGCGTW